MTKNRTFKIQRNYCHYLQETITYVDLHETSRYTYFIKRDLIIRTSTKIEDNDSRDDKHYKHNRNVPDNVSFFNFPIYIFFLRIYLFINEYVSNQFLESHNYAKRLRKMLPIHLNRTFSTINGAVIFVLSLFSFLRVYHLT